MFFLLSDRWNRAGFLNRNGLLTFDRCRRSLLCIPVSTGYITPRELRSLVVLSDLDAIPDERDHSKRSSSTELLGDSVLRILHTFHEGFDLAFSSLPGLTHERYQVVLDEFFGCLIALELTFDEGRNVNLFSLAFLTVSENSERLQVLLIGAEYVEYPVIFV